MRILLHYTHKQTLGHTTRTISLAAALCRCGADVLILQGGMPQSYVKFPKGCNVLDIPYPFDTRMSFKSIPAPIATDKRAEFIRKATEEFNPDVFITEFFPFGRLAYMSELLPTLRHLRKKGSRIIASIGYPLLPDLTLLKDKNFANLYKALLSLFNTFLIHTPKELENPYFQKTIQSPALSRLYASVLEKLRNRIIYTGYIFPERIITGGTSLPKTKKTVPTIVISRGGGAVYPKLVTLAIEAHRLLNGNVQTIIACGPSTSPEEMALFQSYLQPQDKNHIFLVNHLDDLDILLSTCRASVSLCGYNTSVQLMRYGTPSIIVPYQNNLSKTSTNDQVARAQLLKEHFCSVILDYNTLNARSIADAINKQLASPRPVPAPSNWFNGADTAARFIVQGIAN